MKVEEIAKKVGVSSPTFRKWIYRNEDFLKQNKIVAIFKNGKRRTIRILDPEKLEQAFFERG